jgi:hypothetical protein
MEHNSGHVLVPPVRSPKLIFTGFSAVDSAPTGSKVRISSNNLEQL